ncbi:hypothetical protein RJ639_010819 [Escallonia herrerae]|uniref:CASP-like protein n=1 Tax=Escallonia herrerae TaxID=1293975 RepID=A0AA89APL3_9ASTE|nr:hypothetical protein RJ639_010819 [Escallonia herrerae]
MSKAKSIPLFLLRLLALGATVCATIVMVTSHESTKVLNMTFEAKYSDSPTFKYFLVVNAVASGYSLIILFLSSKNLTWQLVLVSDLVITSLLISSLSAALGVSQVAKKGNLHAGWLPICGQVPKFCDHVAGALVSELIAAIFYFLLLLNSLHNTLDLLTLQA